MQRRTFSAWFRKGAQAGLPPPPSPEAAARSGPDRQSTALALVATALTLSWALLVHDVWQGHDYAFPLSLSLGFCALALARPRVAWLEARAERAVLLLLGAGLLGHGALLLLTLPSDFLYYVPPRYVRRLAAEHRAAVQLGLGVAVLLGLGALARRPWLGRAHLPLILLVAALLGAWVIHSSPSPPIDVYRMQVAGLQSFLAGHNPYEASGLVDPHGIRSHVYYGPGLSVNGRLTVGYPYPPLTLLLSVPGYVLGADVRYAHLVAFVLAAACIAAAPGGRKARGAALFFLFLPSLLKVLNNAWTEPIVVLLLAAIPLCAKHAPRLLPVALGMFWSSKQYAVFALPLTVLLLPRPLAWPALRALVLRGLGVAILISLPLLLWNPAAFSRSIVEHHMLQPPRLDAMTFMSWLLLHGTRLPLWVPYAAAALVMAIALLRCPRTPAGYAAGVGATFLVLFAFNKQAFVNYYTFVLGAFCCAVAWTRTGSTQDEPAPPPGAG